MSNFYEIEYTGFFCQKASNFDRFSNEDEPYFFFAVSDGFRNLPSKKSGEYANIRTNTARRHPGGIIVWRTTDLAKEREVVALSAAAFEADGGEHDKAQAAFEKAVSAVVKSGVGAAAKGLATGGIAGAAIGFGTTIVASLAAKLASELSWLFGDDEVGVAGVYLSRDDIRRLATTRVQYFGDDRIPWHIVLRIKGGREGTYFLFFRVLSDETGNRNASLHTISASRSGITIRTTKANEDRFLTAGAAHSGNMLLMSNYHDSAYTRRDPAGPSENYWRWRGGQQFSHLVPGRFSRHRGGTEYLMYRASDGRFSILMAGRASLTNGRNRSEGDHTIIDGGQLLTECNIVVPGVFSANAARNRTTDLLLYRTDGGRQEYYTFQTGSGADTNPVTLRDTFKNWEPNWNIITPITWPGRDRSSLLLYNRGEGRAEFWHTSGDAQIARASRHGFFKTWTFITQVDWGFTPEEQVFLFFYSRKHQNAQVWSFPNVKKHADLVIGDFEFLIPDYAQIGDGRVITNQIHGYRVGEAHQG